MRNRNSSTRLSSARGSTIALVLIFTVAVGLVIAAALQRAATEARLNKSAALHNEARLAAESVIQHGMAQLRQRFQRTQQLPAWELHPSNSPLVLDDSFKSFIGQNRVSSHLDLPTGTYRASNFAAYKTAVLGEVVNQVSIGAKVDPMSAIPDKNAAVIDARVREVRVYGKATAVDPSLGSRTAYAKKTFQVLDLSLFQYAVFYNHDMELYPGANMNLGEGGPIHVNGDAYIGAEGGTKLDVHSRITVSGDFFVSRHPNYNGAVPSTNDIRLRNLHARNDPTDYLVRLVDAAADSPRSPTKYLTSGSEDFAELALNHFNGGLLTQEHNIDVVHPAGLGAFTELFPPGAGQTGNHAYNLIRPVANETELTDPSLSEQQKEVVRTVEEVKWANKAKLTLELDASGATPDVKVYTYSYDADGKIEYNASGSPKTVAVDVPSGHEFWSVEEFTKVDGNVTSGIYDYRQAGGNSDSSSGKINLLKLDVEKMREWVESDDSAVFDPAVWNGVVYVKMPEVSDPGREDRVIPASSKWATQLVKGKQIPNRVSSGVRGMTLATNGPLYVAGDYNAPHGGTSSSTNPVVNGNQHTFGNQGYEAPAALIADAITILSNNWTNTKSAKPLDNRVATDTIVSAAFVTGIVPSKNNYSGGVENFPRFLEKWGGKVLTYRGSLISLFKSEAHKASWGSSNVYAAPNRNWGFHQGFVDLPPPGDPGGRIYRQISFTEMSQDDFEAETAAILGGGGS